MTARGILLTIAGSFSFLAVSLSSWLIYHHQVNMTKFAIQTKIVGIIWMIPIYSVDSFLSLLFPSVSLYIDMLRDCYEAYVLYLFLSLMLSYLNFDGDEEVGDPTNDRDELICYLENKEPPPRLPFPFSVVFSGELPKGEKFLRFCKFGTLQYCLFRPTTTFLAIVLEQFGLYHESVFSTHSGWLYLTVMVNISIAFAFAALATFYTTLKKKLAPFEPVGKFLCIKFVIFFAFWQSVIIAVLVRTDIIHPIDGYTTHNLSRGLQNTLICVEMFLVSVAHLFTFSYKPFSEVEMKKKRLKEFSDMTVGISLKGSLIQSQNSAVPASPGNPSKKKDDKSRNQNNKNEYRVLVKDKDSGKIGGVANLYVPPNSETRQDRSNSRSISIDETRNKNEKKKNAVSYVQTDVIPPITAEGEGDVDLSSIPKSNSGSKGSKNILMGIIDRNFASGAAVRDFNESMPIIVLPSNFTPQKGHVTVSRPSDRISDT